MMTMTTMNDRAEPEFSLTRDRVARVLAMLEAKRANGGLNAAETKAHEVATLRLYRRRGFTEKVRPHRCATSRRRAARSISLRRRRADRTHELARGADSESDP